jgi:hypothetical protein
MVYFIRTSPLREATTLSGWSTACGRMPFASPSSDLLLCSGAMFLDGS